MSTGLRKNENGEYDYDATFADDPWSVLSRSLHWTSPNYDYWRDHLHDSLNELSCSLRAHSELLERELHQRQPHEGASHLTEPKGDEQSFRQNIQGFAHWMQETQNSDVVHALLTSKKAERKQKAALRATANAQAARQRKMAKHQQRGRREKFAAGMRAPARRASRKR